MSDYFAKLREKRKQLGLCLSCGKHPSPCQPCRERNKEYMRRKRAGIPQEQKSREWHSKRHYYLKYKYGITEQQYDDMFNAQGSKCAICGSTETKDKKRHRLVVDHDHATGAVRGLLCSSCNKALGLFSDSIETMYSAIKYLKNVIPKN